MDNYKAVRLPTIFNSKIKPIILIAYDEMGQSTWYLFTLNELYQPISNIILYTNKQIQEGVEATTYDISRDYKINTIKSIISNNKEKIIEKKLYTISENGQLNLKK